MHTIRTRMKPKKIVFVFGIHDYTIKFWLTKSRFIETKPLAKFNFEKMPFVCVCVYSTKLEVWDARCEVRRIDIRTKISFFFGSKADEPKRFLYHPKPKIFTKSVRFIWMPTIPIGLIGIKHLTIYNLIGSYFKKYGEIKARSCYVRCANDFHSK